jgi:EmrB/QacA subfamily drug resistance transporter
VTATTAEDFGRRSPPDDLPRGGDVRPWRALWAMMVGFFMILLDSTIVAVANPRIMEKLHTDYNAVIWVTSAYLLAYAVPLLVAGRLGDRFGPKNLYLVGLAIFTGSSLWCGLAGSVHMLIAARVAQGLGAALLTPQTLSTITRIFPPERRGVAMSLWGATAGVATLVGPLAGGVLVDRLGWQWIFFVNVPVGIVGLGLGAWLIPVLRTHRHRFDVLGVSLSGAGVFLIVFGLQEGQSHDWAPWIWATIAGGVGFMAVFGYWQLINRREPLIPLEIFRDRDFSLSNFGIAVMGFVAVGMVLPLMFYLQGVCGLSPTRSALLTAPMAIATGMLAPIVGRIVDRSHPSPVIGSGFAVLSIALTWLSIEMTPATPIWRLVLPMAAIGVGMSFIWAPLAATATRNLPPELAGAASGVYNAIRQVGSVLGSAGMAAFMTARISAELPPMPAGGPSGEQGVAQLPGFLHQPFAAAMSQSMLLPAFVSLFGVVAALFLVGGRPAAREPRTAPSADDMSADDPERTEVIPAIDIDFAIGYDNDGGEYFEDDDAYFEYTIARSAPEPDADDSDTEPMATRAKPARGEPVDLWPREGVETLHRDPLDSWHRRATAPTVERNGFHIAHERSFQEIYDRIRREGELPFGGARHRLEPGHHRFDPEPETYGRHAMPTRDY